MVQSNLTRSTGCTPILMIILRSTTTVAFHGLGSSEERTIVNWNELLSPRRLGCPEQKSPGRLDRTEFERDFDRIIFSPYFRRLHGKTQVFPFPEDDCIHTRLTHSLETASVGRSLGTIVGNKLALRYPKLAELDLNDIICAACLAHDVGNPPLGHSGEKAIAEFFDSDRGREITGGLSDEERKDFTSFNGNAMGFHILCHSDLRKTKVRGGMGLTYPTLAAFMKYPRPSLIDGRPKGASEEKSGILQYDMSHFSEVAEGLGLLKKRAGDRWGRHPLAFLTEAADDICYRIMDFEDGYRHGLIPFDKAQDMLLPICLAKTGETKIDGLKNIIDEKERVGYLRAKAINSLTFQAADVFLKHEKEILSGTFDQRLLTLVESAGDVEAIREESECKVYSYKSVVRVEAAGFQVLPGLLDMLLFAIKEKNIKNSSKKILELVPKEYVLDYEECRYDAILAITTYVVGMTDNFAIDLFRNLMGIQLPNY